MRRQISQKKRFAVLERDNFRCKYCGASSNSTVLEVDHIVPRSKGGSNDLDNLITACHACNRGKGSKVLGEPEVDLYKQKTQQVINKAKGYFYGKWNDCFMGTIDKKTQTLIAMFINDYFTNYISGCRTEEQASLFVVGGDVCDDVLSSMLGDFKKQEADHYIEYAFDDENRSRNKERDYASKLNYALTEDMIDKYFNDNKEYVLRKFSLHPHLVKDA